MLPKERIDIALALRKIHELGLADGDLGYTYCYQVGQLLKRASYMRAEIDLLREELDRCQNVCPSQAKAAAPAKKFSILDLAESMQTDKHVDIDEMNPWQS